MSRTVLVLVLCACAPLVFQSVAEEKPNQILTSLSSSTISGYVEAAADPARASSMAGNEQWQPGFSLPPGVDGAVNAFAIVGRDLYVGGQFQRAGDLVVNSLARWDGTNWHPVANGVRGIVYALAASGTNLYVGGFFDRAGDVPAANLACWTGTAWRNIGDVSGRDYNSFFPARVVCLLTSGRELIIGGSFREAGGVNATNVARWDGTRWRALGPGVGSRGGEVHALGKAGARIYAGGMFFNAGDVLATNIACWNGARWLPLGNGVAGGARTYTLEGQPQSGVVNAIAISGLSVCVGGTFSHAGASKAANLARWRSGHWQEMGGGVGSDGEASGVNSLTIRRGELIASGAFTRAGKVTATNVASWNGLRWRTLGAGVNGVASSTAIFRGALYVGGDFGMAGGSSAANVANWNGRSWSALGSGMGNTVLGFVNTLAVGQSDVFVGGSIHSAGTNRVSLVARWDRSHWFRLGTGLGEGEVWMSAASGGDYYVAGSFSRPAVGATNLAHWNGYEWSGLGAGLQTSNGVAATIHSMAVQRGRLFVAGDFQFSGSNALANVAMWDGATWSSVGTNAPNASLPQRVPQLMIADDENLYVAGLAEDALGNPINAIFRWDGSQWTEIGRGGYAANVQCLALFRGDLFVTGNFNDDTPSDWAGFNQTRLVRWNGIEWSAVDWPFGQGSYIPALAATSQFLYVGGQLAFPFPGMARFDGTQWFSCGSGVAEYNGSGTVTALATSSNQVFVGGIFKTAAAKPSYRFAVWNEE